MQQDTITDLDGVTRRYAFDSYNGMLFVRDDAGAVSPGRPYRPIYAAKSPSVFALAKAHAEMWGDPDGAQAAINKVAPQDAWRGAY